MLMRLEITMLNDLRFNPDSSSSSDPALYLIKFPLVQCLQKNQKDSSYITKRNKIDILAKKYPYHCEHFWFQKWPFKYVHNK